MPALVLLAAFIAVPLLEIAVFIQVGGLLGLWPTLGLVILTAVAGTWLLRVQGLATLGRARQQMDRGVMPARELFDGLCLLFAGALLLTPGFVTDTLGLLLFVPLLRNLLRGYLSRYIKTSASTRVWTDGQEVRRPRNSGTIEGDYQDVTPEDVTPEDATPEDGDRQDPSSRRWQEDDKDSWRGGTTHRP